MITETAAGGEGGAGEAVALADEAAVQEFAGQFETDAMQMQLTETFQTRPRSPTGRRCTPRWWPIGCDVPPGVLVTSTDDAGS